MQLGFRARLHEGSPRRKITAEMCNQSDLGLFAQHVAGASVREGCAVNDGAALDRASGMERQPQLWHTYLQNP